MKLLPRLALNVVVVALALVAYDQLRSDAAPETQVNAIDTTDDGLERRIDALETERRRPRRSAETDPSVLARLDALEERSAPAVDRQTAGDTPAETSAAEGGPPKPSLAEPTKAETKRFRQLRDAVRREDAVKKNARRIDAILGNLQVSLTDAQRTKVHNAYAAFQSRVGEIWGEVKARAQETTANGGDVDRATIVADTTAVIQEEFAESLGTIVPPADAELIAAGLLAGGK
jgi:hypothetical protein